MKKRNSLRSVVPFSTDHRHKQNRFTLIIGSLFLLLLGMGRPAFAQDTAGEKSPLASGRWVKISVDKSGLYTLSYDKLRQMGFSNPEAVGVYGHGGRLLSEELQKASSVAGLPQVPLLRHNNAIYFYGEGPTTWYYDTAEKCYRHVTNHYTRLGYYLLSDAATPGPLLMEERKPTVSQSAPALTTTYDALVLHEQDKFSPRQSGRLLFGEPLMGGQPKRILVDLGSGEQAGNTFKVNYAYMARPNTQGFFTLTLDGKEISQDAISLGEDHTSRDFLAGIYHFKPNVTATSNSKNLAFEASYRPTGENAYVDFLEFIIEQRLRYTSGRQTEFRKVQEGSDALLYQVSGLPQDGIILATSTEGALPYRVQTTQGEGSHSFSTQALDPNGQPYTFLACSWQDAYAPNFVGEVANQDIHSAPIPDLIILSPEAFLSEAERLAEYHRSADGLQVLVVEEAALFNEFNAGTPDATAYRLMAKYFHDRWMTAHPDVKESVQQLLLFGDGAGDNRKVSTNWESIGLQNTPFLLTYQSVNSLNVYSYTTDDYFGYLRDGEDHLTNGRKQLSIGIGRFPIRTIGEAKATVDKTIRYAENRDPGVWKTRTLFLADNKDSYSHAKQANELTEIVEEIQPELIVNKVYLDAFPKSTVNGLTTVPTAKRKLLDAIDQGLLLVNYTGHGSPTAWTDEQIMTLPDIQRLSNKRLPLWITATCDFSPYDNSTTSAGEMAFLNNRGGASALFTTTRVVFDVPNQELNRYFLRTLFTQDKGGRLHQLGDVLRNAKNNAYASDTINKLNFALIGDPALRLKMPTHQVTLLKINGKDPDPQKGIFLHALERVSLEGAIHDLSGTIDGNFNGTIAITVFDAKQISSTLEENIPEYQENVYQYSEYPGIIYAGNAEVVNGHFTASFVVPKDISYSDRKGKINFYAYSPELKREAMGVDKSLKLQMGESGSEEDNTPPEIRRVYLNDSTLTAPFVVGPTPLFVAELFDTSGINLSAGGLGHGITLSIDNNPTYTFTLNDYYRANQLEAGKGSVVYLLPTLPEGDHTATLRVWDVFNNATEKSFSFRVNKDLAPQVAASQAYPNPAVVGSPITFEIFTSTPGEEMSLTIELFDFTGRCVAKSQTFSLVSPTQGSISIPWTPTTSYQTSPSSGLYIYRCTLSGSNGKSTTTRGKILLQESPSGATK